MGSYASIAVRDASGNIVGYKSTSTGQIVETTGAASPAFQTLQQQAEIQKYRSVGALGSYAQSVQYTATPSFDTTTAAGIAAQVAATGGVQNPYLASKASQMYGIDPAALTIATPGGKLTTLAEAQSGRSDIDYGRSTVPIRDLSSGMGRDSFGVELPVEAAYYKYRGGQVEVKGKTYMDTVTGEVTTFGDMGGRNIRNIAGGSSIYGAQSGTISIKPMSTLIYSQDFAQYAKDDTRRYSEKSTGAYKDVDISPSKYSRPGAEAYGGWGGIALDSRTLKDTTTPSRYEMGSGNLANFLTAEGRVYTKGAKVGEQNVGLVDYGYPVGGMNVLRTTKRETESKILASYPEVSMNVPAPFVSTPLPKPFLSTSTIPSTVQTTTELKPTGRIFGAYIPGASEALAFFQPSQKVTATQVTTQSPKITTLKETRITEIPEGTMTERIYETTGGGASVARGVSSEEIAGSSGWDRLNKGISSLMPAPKVGEKGVEISQLFNPLSQENIGIRAGREIVYRGVEAIGGKSVGARATQAAASEITSPTKGVYTEVYEQPLLAPASYLIGGGLGVGAKVAESTYMAGRGMLASRAISQGGVARGIEQAGGFIMGRAPQALTALYGVDIAARSTEGFSKITPESASKARGIVTAEAAPLTFGFARGFGATETAMTELPARYKQAQMDIAESKYLASRPAGTSEPVEAIAKIAPESITAREVLSYKFGEVRAGVTSTAKGAITTAAEWQPVKTAEFARIGVQQMWVEKAPAARAAVRGAAESLYSPYLTAKTELATGLPTFRATAGTLTGKAMEATAKTTYAPTALYGRYFGAKTEAVTGFPSIMASHSVKAARVTASDLPYMVRAKAKGIARSGLVKTDYSVAGSELKPAALAPEDEYAFRYGEGENYLNLFGKSVGKILPPTTFGETRPAPGAFVGASRLGEPSGATTRKSPSVGGTGTVVKSTRVVGGREVSMPSVERSLPREPITRERTRPTWRSTDYRGQAPSKMKPMTGGTTAMTQLISSTLPVTTAKAAPTTMARGAAPTSIFGAASTTTSTQTTTRTPSVSTQRSYALTQRVYVQPASALGTASILSMPQARTQREGVAARVTIPSLISTTAVESEVLQRSRQETSTIQMTRQARATTFMQDTIGGIVGPGLMARPAVFAERGGGRGGRASLERTIGLTTPIERATTRAATTARQEQTVISKTTYKEQRPEPIIGKTTEVIPPVTIPILSGGFPGGSAQPVSTSGRGRSALREVLPIRSSLEALFGARETLVRVPPPARRIVIHGKKRR